MSNRKLSNVARHLVNARTTLERGWIQGAARTRIGVCMIGALADANADALASTYHGAHTMLVRALDERGWDSPIEAFNDAPGTRREDVLAVYDRAIELAA